MQEVCGELIIDLLDALLESFKVMPAVDRFIQGFNPSSPKGGCTNPPNGFRPGAQNRTAKG